MKRLDAKTKKIIAATSVTIFSLLALTLGTFAWFASSLVAQTTNDEFQVVITGGCKIESINLYKFIYPKSTIGDGYDYLKPQLGRVDKYAFSEEYRKFGYYDVYDNWISVEEMNIYDPIEMLISQDKSLKEMNCNAIYEVTLSYTENTEVNFDIDVVLDTTKTAQEGQILLSDCVDFDMFYSSDLRDNNPLFYDESTGLYNKYYPSYKSVLSTDNEKDFHKLSYLSSLIASNAHTHFYGKTPKDESLDLDSRTITFDEEGKAKVYINANYAPSELAQYSKDIYLNNIYAIYDFGFMLTVTEANE